MKNVSFQRKMGYVIAIAILLYPMFLLSQPSSANRDGKPGAPGGKLAQLRTQYDFDESELGDVDLLSTSFRLFGMTPVANTFLWNKANEYKMKKDWTNLAATLNQLARLIPHFETVWRFQGWNLAYNVSVEFDDYRQRYHWVIRGIEFLKEGVKMNKRSIRLTWDVGWDTSQKIGKSDERVQFRRLYRADNDLHGSRPMEQRDCWLVGKEWYYRAEDVVKSGVPLGSISEVLFYSNAPMNQMSYSDNLEKDGRFDESVERSWKQAAAEWKAYGNREIKTSIGPVIRLNDQELFDEQKARLEKEFEALQPGLRAQIVEERRKTLTPEQLAAYNKSPDDKTADEFNLTSEAENILRVTNQEVAQRMTADRRGRGEEMAKKLDNATDQSTWTERYREVVNFTYWRHRGQFDQRKEIINARKLFYDGRQAFRKGDLVVSKRNFDEAFQIMRQTMDLPEFAGLDKEDAMGLDVRELMETYVNILQQRNEQLPDDFILMDVYKKSKD